MKGITKCIIILLQISLRYEGVNSFASRITRKSSSCSSSKVVTTNEPTRRKKSQLGSSSTRTSGKFLNRSLAQIAETKQTLLCSMIGVCFLSGLCFSPFPAEAELTAAQVTTPMASFSPSLYNNEYADPFHPMCQRKIEVIENGKAFHYSGTAVGPKDDPVNRGCSKAEQKAFGLRKGAFDGKIIDGNRLDAGDGVHEGIWEPKNTATTNLGYEDVDGIRWNDGNKWVVKSQSRIAVVDGKNVVRSKGDATKIGEAIFYAYIGFSTLAGMKGLYDGIQRRRNV